MNGIKRGWAAALLFGVLILVGLACVFSPQSARQSASAIGVQRFTVTARQWEMTPNEIRVKVNEPVELKVISVDVDHGIEFAGLNVPVERVPAGRTVTVKFIPDKKGNYQFRCAVLCGVGHDRMTGTLVVE